MPTTTYRKLRGTVADAAGLPPIGMTERQRKLLTCPGLKFWGRGRHMVDLTNGTWKTRTIGNTAFTVRRPGIVPTNPVRADFNNQRVIQFGDATGNLGELISPGLYPLGSHTMIQVGLADPVNTTVTGLYWGDDRGTASGSYLDHAADGSMRWRHNGTPVVNSAAGQPRAKKLIVASYLDGATATTRRAVLRLNRNPATQWTNSNVTAGPNTATQLHLGQCGIPGNLGFINRNGAVGDDVVIDGFGLAEADYLYWMALWEEELGEFYGIAAP